MLKILKARLRQYMDQEHPDVQAGFRKGRGTWGQIANIHWISEKTRDFQKNIYFYFIDYAKAFWVCGSQQTVENSSRDGKTRPPNHHLRNLYADQEATVRTGHGTTYWLKIRKIVHQGYILSPCLFNLYAEYIMWNAGLDEAEVNVFWNSLVFYMIQKTPTI